MDTKFIEQIITGAPNFLGFILAIFILSRQLTKKDELIVLLIGKWEACEDDAEKAKLIEKQATN